MDAEISRKLKELNENTREWHKKRRELIAGNLIIPIPLSNTCLAGPKFLRHSFSPFGRVLLVHAMTQNLFAIITAKNSLEIWEFESGGENGEQKCYIYEVYEIPGHSITSAIHLFQHEMDGDNIDLLKGVPDSERILQGVRNNIPFPKRKPTSTNEKKNTQQDEGGDNYIKEEDEDTAPSINIPNEFMRRNSFLKTYNDLDKLASSKMPSWQAEKLLINWKTYPLTDAPSIYFKSVFFVGSSSGVGTIIELSTAYDPLSRKTATTCQIRLQKQISQSPIKLALCNRLNDGTPVVVCEVVTKTAEHFVIGVTLDLEIEWACRCDVIRMSMTDKCTRYISKEQQMVIHDDKKETRAPEDFLITAIDYDDIHSCILLGTIGGSVLRLFYQHDKAGGSNVNLEKGSSGSPVKLVWCLEVGY